MKSLVVRENAFGAGGLWIVLGFQLIGSLSIICAQFRQVDFFAFVLPLNSLRLLHWMVLLFKSTHLMNGPPFPGIFCCDGQVCDFFSSHSCFKEIFSTFTSFAGRSPICLFAIIFILIDICISLYLSLGSQTIIIFKFQIYLRYVVKLAKCHKILKSKPSEIPCM